MKEEEGEGGVQIQNEPEVLETENEPFAKSGNTRRTTIKVVIISLHHSSNFVFSLSV